MRSLELFQNWFLEFPLNKLFLSSSPLFLFWYKTCTHGTAVSTDVLMSMIRFEGVGFYDESVSNYNWMSLTAESKNKNTWSSTHPSEELLLWLCYKVNI